MKYQKEYSYGIIPLAYHAGDWEVLLVKPFSGNHWSFPKGHKLGKESPWKAAERELKEETGLSVRRLISDEVLKESYFFKKEGILISKQVDYFIAEVEGEIVLQAEEIGDFQWVPLKYAVDKLTYPQAKEAAKKTIEILKFNKNLD